MGEAYNGRTGMLAIDGCNTTAHQVENFQIVAFGTIHLEVESLGDKGVTALLGHRVDSERIGEIGHKNGVGSEGYGTGIIGIVVVPA